VLPGSYHYYSEWVWFDNPAAGSYQLPAPDNFASITFVQDKGPSYDGIIRIALSPDGHDAEMMAPFRGFMRDPQGNPIIGLGKTLNISMSLEASGELAPGGTWASDTGQPIVGYYLSPFPEPGLRIAHQDTAGGVLVSWNPRAKGMLLQQTASLINPDWQTITGSESTNEVVVAPATGISFFRLVEP
jgi:hypothetical protein